MNYVITEYEPYYGHIIDRHYYHKAENAKAKFITMVKKAVIEHENLAEIVFEEFGRNVDEYAEWCWDNGRCEEIIDVDIIKWEDK